MKTLGYLMTALISLIVAGTSEAGEGRAYVGGQAGMFLPIKSSVYGDFPEGSGRLTYDAGFVLTAIGGYQFGNGIRGEGELNLRHVTTDKLYTAGERLEVSGGAWSYGFMTNVYYDFRTRTAVTPFLGAGVGVVAARFEKGTSNGTTLWSADEDVSVAYQGLAGFALRIDDNTALDFVYRHYAIPRLHFETLSAQFRGLNLSLGLRHFF